MDDEPMEIYADRGLHELLDGRNNDGKTPLHLACQEGHLEVVRILMSYGADSNLLDNDGKTAWDLAAEHGHAPILEYLDGLSDVRLE